MMNRLVQTAEFQAVVDAVYDFYERCIQLSSHYTETAPFGIQTTMGMVLSLLTRKSESEGRSSTFRLLLTPIFTQTLTWICPWAWASGVVRLSYTLGAAK